MTCDSGRLQIAPLGQGRARDVQIDSSVMSALEHGQVHELLSDHPALDNAPLSVAAWLARTHLSGGNLVWCESSVNLNAQALALADLSPERLYRVQPRNHGEAVWAMTEALRCRGIRVVIAMPMRLSDVEARRLQLAAERGGGIGILLRRSHEKIHAARTRWLVKPALGDALTQRWRVELIHGHGRPTGQSFLLEVDRETHHVRENAVVADRSREAPPAVVAG